MPSAATNAIVSWTPPTWGWHLEETPGLNPAAWTNSPSGEFNPASVGTSKTAKIYRLNNQQAGRARSLCEPRRARSEASYPIPREKES